LRKVTSAPQRNFRMRITREHGMADALGV